MSQGILDEHDLQAQFSRKAVQAAKAFLKEPGFSQIAIGEQAVLARFNDSDWVSIQSPSRRLISYCSCESEDNVHGIAAALYQGGLQAARPPRFIQASNTEQLEYPIEVPESIPLIFTGFWSRIHHRARSQFMPEAPMGRF